MLGFVLPPQIGLIFVLIKPQIGIGVTLFWFFEEWRKGGLKQVVRTFMPVTIFFLISFLLYGFWPLHFKDTLAIVEETKSGMGFNYNSSLWPYGLIIGFFLLARSIYKEDKKLGIMSSPFLSPYTIMSTYGAPLIALAEKPLFFVTFWLLLWSLVLFKALL